MHPSARRLLRSLRAAGVNRVPRPEPVGAEVPSRPADPLPPDPLPPQGQAARPAVAEPGRPAAVAPRATAPRGTHGAKAPRPTSAAAPEAGPSEGWIDRALDDRPQPASDPAAVLAEVATEVAACSACDLCDQRQHTVPGEGSPTADIVFVGEGPGADEDRSGRPFVGPAGQLLDDIITKGMKRRREDVFICNVVKCRPPGNRTPTSREASACGAFLERQLRAIAPKVICSLGAAATHLLLDTDRPIGKLRGRAASWHGIPVIPTYHPAYLLRSPEAKKPCWEDIQMVMGIADRT